MALMKSMKLNAIQEKQRRVELLEKAWKISGKGKKQFFEEDLQTPIISRKVTAYFIAKDKVPDAIVEKIEAYLAENE